MANDTSAQPMRIDTFGSDVTISATSCRIQNITVTAYTSAKTVTFIDNNGEVVLVLECPSGSSISWPPAGNFGERGAPFQRGLYLDDSASDLAANDFVFVWKY